MADTVVATILQVMLHLTHRYVAHIMQEPSSIEKIAEIDEHIGCAMSGLTADAKTLVDHARADTQVWRRHGIYNDGARSAATADNSSVTSMFQLQSNGTSQSVELVMFPRVQSAPSAACYPTLGDNRLSCLLYFCSNIDSHTMSPCQ